MPLGIHHIMEGGGHYDPKPETVNKKSLEYSGVYYHQTDSKGIGFDRTQTGSDAVAQYAPPVGDRFASLIDCPPELLLWFHHVGWDYRTRDIHVVMAAFQPAMPKNRAGAIFNPLRSRRNLREKLTVQVE